MHSLVQQIMRPSLLLPESERVPCWAAAPYNKFHFNEGKVQDTDAVRYTADTSSTLGTKCVTGVSSHVDAFDDNRHSSESVTLGLSYRAKCDSFCTCSCHKRRSVLSPRFFDRFIGSLFVAYAGLPMPSDCCDIPSCQGNSPARANIYYTFPRWLLQRMLNINIAYFQNWGPELLIRTLRVRESCDKVYYLFSVHPPYLLPRVQEYLVGNKASVLDVDQFGRSLLHVSASPKLESCGY